jgi:hypothetical protein
MRAGRSAACPPAGSGRCHCGVWKYPWGPDGIFVYGGAHCYPAGVIPLDLATLSRNSRGVTLFSQNLHKKFRGSFSLVFDRTKGRCFSSELSQYASNDRFAKLDTHNCSERTLSRIAFMVRIRGRSG